MPTGARRAPSLSRRPRLTLVSTDFIVLFQVATRERLMIIVVILTNRIRYFERTSDITQNTF